MNLPEDFINEMNDFFSRQKDVPLEGFYESFDKEPLKGIRFSRSKINSTEEEHRLLKGLGEEAVPVSYAAGGGLSVFMLVGLQGAGKTTHCGKLANLLRKQDKKKPLLIAGDIYRPAAINQLVTVGKQLGIEVFERGNNLPVTKIVSEGLEYARKNHFDLVKSGRATKQIGRLSAQTLNGCLSGTSRIC